MKKLCLLGFIAFCFITEVSAQMYFKEGRQLCCGDSILSGNVQALGINPSQLGRVGSKQKSVDFLQLGNNFYSSRLNLSKLLTFAFSNDSVGNELKQQLMDPASVGPFIFDGNLELNWIGFSYATPQLGGIAVQVTDRINSYSTIPNSLLSILLEGKNSSYYQEANSASDLAKLGNDSRIFFSHIREAIVGYGRKVFGGPNSVISLYVGGSVKRLWGIGYFNVDIRDEKISGLSSFSEFYNINYGDLPVNSNQGSMDAFKRKLLSNTGSGWGYDFGATLEITKRFSVGASIVDIGKITWKEKIVTSNADFRSFIEKVDDATIQTLNFKEELGDVYDQFSFSEGESFDVKLNTQMRLNATFRVVPRFTISGDALVPFNNEKMDVINHQSGTYAFNMNYLLIPQPLKLNVSTGIFYSDQYKTRMPLGFSLQLSPTARFSMAATDLLTFINGEKDPYPGLSISGLSILF